MTYRLIALDVDGTLLTDDHQLTELTKGTIRRVYEQGCGVVLCTGRSPVSTLPVMEKLGLSGTLICHNGAATIASADRSVLHEFAYDVKKIEPLISYCREHGIHFDVNTSFEMYVENLTPEANSMYEQFYIQPKVVDNVLDLDFPIVKFTCAAPKEEMDRIEKEWALLSTELRIIRSGDIFIDVMHAQAHKGSALKALTEVLGVRQEEVVAMGNYYNDIEMLTFAGLGIAMENSPEAVKLAADAVTASNNEDGVHQAIERYVSTDQKQNL
ncbi:hydrolase [Paenibacillus swuensis]|uniref:Hydrolase n=1 Tax=Paenibacillus swuensis TaxID=1178515 RepID=A0A172TQN2_9BACL|nr:Cof-type HAD-IIB family hydrolase [Paenibacillus swuensis]ANE49073.1 hydrolase [Paenibacillus swuensis]